MIMGYSTTKLAYQGSNSIPVDLNAHLSDPSTFGTLNNDTQDYNNRLHGTGSEIDCNDNPDSEWDGSQFSPQQSDFREGSFHGGLEESDNDAEVDEESVAVEHPSTELTVHTKVVNFEDHLSAFRMNSKNVGGADLPVAGDVTGDSEDDSTPVLTPASSESSSMMSPEENTQQGGSSTNAEAEATSVNDKEACMETMKELLTDKYKATQKEMEVQLAKFLKEAIVDQGKSEEHLYACNQMTRSLLRLHALTFDRSMIEIRDATDPAALSRALALGCDKLKIDTSDLQDKLYSVLTCYMPSKDTGW